MNTVHYANCPVCHSNDIHPLLQVKDHTVSKEVFVIWQCNQCLLRFTQDVPDQASIGSYYQSEDYISHTNTSKGLLNQLYQRVRRYTLQQKAAMVISRTTRNGKLLDMGAGIGAFLHTMKEKGWEVTGLEPDAGAREQARKLFQLELQDPSWLNQLAPAQFHAITLWHVLEHVHALHEYIEQLKNLLTENGRIFIAVPNYTSLDASRYGNFWAAYDVPRHLYHFSPSSIHALVGQHGLKVEQEIPMWFDSFYISLLSSKYRFGQTRWFSAGIMGLRSNLQAVFNRKKCSSLIYVMAKN